MQRPIYYPCHRYHTTIGVARNATLSPLTPSLFSILVHYAPVHSMATGHHHTAHSRAMAHHHAVHSQAMAHHHAVHSQAMAHHHAAQSQAMAHHHAAQSQAIGRHGVAHNNARAPCIRVAVMTVFLIVCVILCGYALSAGAPT